MYLDKVEYQLEEKMGDGSWSRVYQTKEEAYPSDEPRYVFFHTADEAREYVGASGRWSADALARKVVQLIEVRTIIRPV